MVILTDVIPSDSLNVWYSTNATQPENLSGTTLLGTDYVGEQDGWYLSTFSIPNTVISPHVWLIFETLFDKRKFYVY